ncbi:MAG TPA: 2-oxo-4-hydroxy-4-carboxy-5-ureidoimidazoline decarboxylase [Arenibaculum sp.]|nr:2-oxo-4-hydroxy-4-carboxy-5-ureidoimidazoline decarboxylase [Arenibaculum sp.]
MITLDTLNAMDRAAFAKALGGIFEHSPWIAEAAWEHRPFARLDDLHATMVDVVTRAGRDRRLALVRAHPELAGEAMRQRLLTAASTGEQKGAGLDDLTAEDAARFDALNRQYRERFGFPFVIAVKGHDKDGILAAFARRLANGQDEELETALDQVARIARFRLEAAVSP